MLPLQIIVDQGTIAMKGYSRTEVSPSDSLVSYTGHSLGDVLPLCRDEVGAFYSTVRYSLRDIVYEPDFCSCSRLVSRVWVTLTVSLIER